MQWGTYSPSSGRLQTINFNIKFTTTNYVGFSNFIRNSSSDTSWGYIYNKQYSYCQFVADHIFDWIVIGY